MKTLKTVLATFGALSLAIVALAVFSSIISKSHATTAEPQAAVNASWDGFNNATQQDKEKLVCESFERQGGFCYAGKAYTKVDAQKIGSACAAIKPNVLAMLPKSQRELCDLALR